MNDYDELDDELDEIDETHRKSNPEIVEDLKEEKSPRTEMVISETSGKLGESDEEHYRKQEAEALAKGLNYSANYYKEKADAEKIYDKIKDK